MSKSESDSTQFRIRVYLPTGFTCTLQLFGKSTFGQLRNQVWNKKSKDFGCSKTEARFRLYTTELFFDDKQTISDLVWIYPSFEGLGTIDRYSLLLESSAQRGDKVLRTSMKVDGKKPIFWQGLLLKCSKATGKGFWKKQYVVFQNQSLMLYASQEEFDKGKKAHKYIAMGSIVPQTDHRSCQTANKKWPFVLDVPAGKGSKAGITVFAGDTEAVRRSFVDAARKYLLFRKSSIVLSILPTLYGNNYAKETGIFRIAGESTKIQQYQEQIDEGCIPNFTQQATNKQNLHNLTGLLKRQLRFMVSPLIPETHYEAFIDIGRQADQAKRIEQLNFVIKSLSSTSVTVLAELFRFLHYATQFEAQSKMGAINFAIVIGPNILRTEADMTNPMKAVEDNKHMQTTISTMIVHYEKILPTMDDLYKFDKATNPKWKYGVIDPPPVSSPLLKGGGSASGFGILDMTKAMQGGGGLGAANAGASKHGQFSFSATDVPPPPMGRPNSMSTAQVSKMKQQLKKVERDHTLVRKGSQTNAPQSDFRSVLKNRTSNKSAKGGAPQLQKKTFSPQQVDFRSKLKPVNRTSNSADSKEEEEEAGDVGSPSSPRLPPPNPIEMMSKEDRQTQKDNTQILDIFQDFEDKMAQFDEEIDGKQSFTESLASQIMELAENNKIQKAPKYAKQIQNKCRLVINAAKAHSDALQVFNQLLNATLSQMEDDEVADDDRKKGKMPRAAKGGAAASKRTAGGPKGHVTAGGPSMNDPNDAAEEEMADGATEITRQDTYDTRAIDSSGSSGLPRFADKKDAEVEKKVAKALFDYPGGYRSNELTFYRGTSLIITKEKEGWVYGYYELEPSLTGWFPKSYVKIISG
eukprot:59329_1